MATKGSTGPQRGTAIVVGVLFIIATAFLFIGQAVYGPILDAPNYLEIASPRSAIVTLGVLLEFACVLAIPLIPVFLFPVLRMHNEALAIGYVVFRLFEAVLYIADLTNKLSLVRLSQRYLEGGAKETAIFQSLGNTLRAENEVRFSLYILIFTLGALILYAVLYQSRLVPRWISVWGFLAAALMMLGAILNMTEALTVIAGSAFELALAVPIAVNEMVLAIWLIARGFNPAAMQVGPARAAVEAV